MLHAPVVNIEIGIRNPIQVLYAQEPVTHMLLMHYLDVRKKRSQNELEENIVRKHDAFP